MNDPVHARRVASLLLSTFLVAAVSLAAGPPPPPPPPQQDAAHGRVVDAAGHPVAGARVTPLPAPPRSETALQDQVVTDQGGRFSLPLPPNGKGNLQGVQIRAVGYPVVILHGVAKAGPRGRAMDLGTIVLKQNAPAE